MKILPRQRDVWARVTRVSIIDHHNSYTAQSLFSNPVKGTYVYCSNEYKPYLCNKVTGVQQRVAILQQKPRCFICLKWGNISKNCTLGCKCRKCG